MLSQTYDSLSVKVLRINMLTVLSANLFLEGRLKHVMLK
jgi:hypothetical protein